MKKIDWDKPMVTRKGLLCSCCIDLVMLIVSCIAIYAIWREEIKAWIMVKVKKIRAKLPW